uniref:hydrocephalus-inducing protein homolog n=1 Tax=Lonchura striata TaxID=40157 RepID=UPI00129376E3|nr:hydrocephalus-inducing protein homolog [Lonchura striata domestica]
MLDVEQPFLVCDEDQQPLPDGQPVTVDVGETCHLYIAFDPAYKLGFNSWKTNKVLKTGMVRGHPFVEHITLQGEVLFPNLQIQPSTLEFGCIVAGTEEVRSLEITSCSPFPVKYHWTFHSDSQVNKLRLSVSCHCQVCCSQEKASRSPSPSLATSTPSLMSRRCAMWREAPPTRWW